MSETREIRRDMKSAPAKNEAASRLLIEICRSDEAAAFRKLASVPDGLTTDQAEDNLGIYGENVLMRAKRTNVVVDILSRFLDPLVIQLLVIAIFTLATGDPVSASIVGGMILLSVFLAFFQERASSSAAEKLQALVQASAIVLRDGKETKIPIHEVVPGDIVILAAGSIIPADLRILQAKDFFVSQSALTGESMPLEKYPNPSDKPVNDALELQNACFQGSNVISGSARALVVNTGLSTFLGSISVTLNRRKDATSFDKGVKSFVWLMIRFMVIMVSTVFLIVGITKHNWMEAFLFALSVAVGLTPEMLPMIVTVCLSKGALSMSKKKVIVKKLKAIQNFGAMNILCTDKTGTLTQDNIILERHVDVTNRQSDDTLRYAYMNSFYETGLRNLLDKAILAHDDLDVEKTCRKIDEIPFDFNRKRTSVIIDYEDTHVLICKGAVEEVYAVCDRYQVDDDIYPLIDMVKNDLVEEYQDLSSEGYRVLAVAYKEFPKTEETFSASHEANLILLGYVAFFDPPKDSSAKAIEALRNSGVEVKILTGDNELVTEKVCHDVGLTITGVMTGPKLAKMDPEDFKKAVISANVFARLSPAQKEKIILTLRSMGNTVGFLGDGINDAPAMKAADVGISVDSAVDIAKESADIILLERSLMVLEDGILEGRKVFANIVKYIKMGASSNFGNMFSMVGSSIILPFLPMAPIQILLNNLLYDISQTGIPTDQVDDDMVKKPHPWDISFIQKFMIFIGPISSIFDYATFFLMLYFFNCVAFSAAGISPADKAHYEALFHTGWFVESLLTQTLIVHIIRTNRIPFIQSRASWAMTFTTLSIMAVAAILPYLPFSNLIGLVPLPWTYWPWIGLFLLLYSILTHFVKTLFNRKFGGQ
jgi:Mg2+-importing ATPase